ncbi:MAG: flagellar biosynthetic protein FliO, partial [Nitrospinota bacterium]|nr:flagellar biosynthetic protein FliO [Nitrospinota bacterium]
IALVEVAGEVLVLGVSQENITLLTSITSHEKIEEIKNAGNKGKNVRSSNSNLFEDIKDRTPSGKEKAVGQFSSYLSKFARPQEEKVKLVSDTKEQILQKIGKLKTARA